MSLCANCSSKVVLFACGGPCQGSVQYCSKACGKEHFAEHAGKCMLSFIEGKRTLEEMQEQDALPPPKLLTKAQLLEIQLKGVDEYYKTSLNVEKAKWDAITIAQLPGLTMELFQQSIEALKEKNLEEARQMFSTVRDAMIRARERTAIVIIDTLRRVELGNIREKRKFKLGDPSVYTSIATIMEVLGYSIPADQIALLIQNLEKARVNNTLKQPNTLMYKYIEAEKEIMQAMIYGLDTSGRLESPDQIYDMIVAFIVQNWREGNFDTNIVIDWKRIRELFKTLLGKKKVSKASELKKTWIQEPREQERLTAWIKENKPKYMAAFELMHFVGAE